MYHCLLLLAARELVVFLAAVARRLHPLRFLCTNVIVSNLSRDNIFFSTFYTGLFSLFRKKNWGGTGPPPGHSPCYGTGLSTAMSTAMSTDISVDITHSKQDPNILSD